jgi:hypothetical protein
LVLHTVDLAVVVGATIVLVELDGRWVVWLVVFGDAVEGEVLAVVATGVAVMVVTAGELVVVLVAVVVVVVDGVAVPNTQPRAPLEIFWHTASAGATHLEVAPT